MKVNSALLEDLQWRGLISQSTDFDALAELLESGSIRYYCGFDPTAPSLHHGNLVQLILMRHLQNYGHKPYCIVGGATGLIGDPRQSGERTLNDCEIVEQWGSKLVEQFKHFLCFEGENQAEVLNNYDWTSKLSAIDLLRNIGKNFRIGVMLAKDTVKSRLDGEGLSFTEFSYQVLQGYDYYVLNRDYNIVLQTGGQDQWGNLTSGLDLIRKLTAKEVHVLTTPLITKSDGTKFGKSEGGAIWLDANMMSPYEFYQFWLNVEDEEVIKLLKAYTFMTRDEIELLAVEVAQNPNTRQAQRQLAYEVTSFVHGSKATEQAINASAALFGRSNLTELSATTLSAAISGIEVVNAKVGDKLVDQFIATNLASSFGEYRKTLTSGGYYVNNYKVDSFDQLIKAENVLNGEIVLLRKGKKTIAAVKIKR